MIYTYRYFKHKSDNIIATQSGTTDYLNSKVNTGLEFFEVQVEISNIMQTKLKNYNPNDWIKIKKTEYDSLLVTNIKCHD